MRESSCTVSGARIFSYHRNRTNFHMQKWNSKHHATLIVPSASKHCIIFILISTIHCLYYQGVPNIFSNTAITRALS
jgi:hypothetical protein